MVMCPYCRRSFDVKYYDRIHVPCPENKGDKEVR